MKKTTLFLVAFALLTLVFGAYNTAEAVTTAPACQSGWAFNPFTGAPCSAPTLPPGCLSGYAYSYLTGQPCEAYPVPMPTPVSQIVIDGVSGPQKLDIGQKGTWKVSAYDKNGRDLSYSVKWGDEPVMAPAFDGYAGMSAVAVQQSATFTHTYKTAGNYYPTFTVSNEYGGDSNSTSLSVMVGNTTTTKGTLYIEPTSISLQINENEKIAAYYQPPMPTCPIYKVCAQVMPSRVKVEPDWGVKWADDGTIIADFENINGEWTLKGVSPGTTELTARYTPQGGTDLIAKAKVVVGSSKVSLAVFSPNGGEIWQRGTNKSINWQNAKSVSARYDISLSSDIPSSAVPYTIARNISGTFYHDALTFWWSVGKVIDGNYTPPDGQYKVRVCQTGTDICDLSDRYFKITSGVAQPFIALTGSYNENIYEKRISVKVGDTFTVSAEPQGLELDEMSYWYGSGKPPAGYYNRAWFFDQNFINSNSCTQELWSMKCTVKNPGTTYFYVTMYANGTSYTSNKITVEAASSGTTYIKVISPNGGVYYLDEPLKISWTAYKGDLDHYYVSLGNKQSGIAINVTPDKHISKYSTSYTVTNLKDLVNEILVNSQGHTAEDMRESYYVEVTPAKFNASHDTLESLAPLGARGELFTILPGITGSKITVLSPNGGETWAKGTVQTISWSDLNPVYPCFVAPCPSSTYQIKLYRETETEAFYPITNRTTGSSFVWPVGTYNQYDSDENYVPDGTYRLEVCRLGDYKCDSSDNYFKIVSGGEVLGAEQHSFTQKLELGMAGDEVKELQKYLTKNGYYAGDIDGKFGIQTQKALVSFQITNGLTVDGVVGAAVRAILNK